MGGVVSTAIGVWRHFRHVLMLCMIVMLVLVVLVRMSVVHAFFPVG